MKITLIFLQCMQVISFIIKFYGDFDCTLRLSIIGNDNLNNCLNGVLGINVVFVKHVMNIKKMLGQRHTS